MSQNGAAPVFVAAQAGAAAIVELLHRAGADINRPKLDGVTPVFVAAQRGLTSTVAALQRLGADVSRANKVRCVCV